MVSSMTWQECIEAANTQNAEILNGRANLQKTEALVKAARGEFFPVLEGKLETARVDKESADVVETNGAHLAIKQNLFNGFMDVSRMDQAQHNREAARSYLDTLKAKISYQLKTAYQNLLVAQKTLRLADEIIVRRKRNADLVKLRFQGGRENKGSVLLSNANYEQANVEKLQAINSIELARLRLAKVIGRNELDHLTLQGEIPRSKPPAQVDLQALAVAAPEVRSAAAQLRAAQAGIKMARENLFPSLDLEASIGRSGPRWPPSEDDGTVALKLTIPLFAGGRDYYGMEAARATAAVSVHIRDATLRDKLISLRESYNSYLENVERESLAQNFLVAARTRAEIARNKYNTGLLSFEEWDIIETDLVAREKTALTSQADRINSEALWEQHQGRGVLP